MRRLTEEHKKKISESMRKRTEVIDALPAGIKIGDKPDGFEVYMGRSSDKWIPYVQALTHLEATKTLQIDLSGVDDVRRHMLSVINGVKYTARKMGVTKKIKSALINNILHITL